MYTKGGTAGGWIHVSHGKTQIALVHPKYVDAFVAAPDMYEELVEAKGWLGDFVMRFYISAETPTYEKMKLLYQELDTFQRELGVKALAKAGERCIP